MPVQRIELGDGRTWTVVGPDHLPIVPVEEFLEFLRVGRDASPHTLRSYAASLNAWWDYLEAAGLAWNEVTLPSFLPFLTVLRTGDPVGVHRLPGAGAAQVGGVAESTVGLRVAAVLSFYRYHADVHGVAVAGRLYRVGGRRARSRYVGALAHLDRGSNHVSPAVRVRTRDRGPAPVLTPAQAEAILDGCARFDAVSGQWAGSVRDRLLFATLSETGMRLGECLSLKHCDWHVGRGGTPFVEVVPRQDHPAGVRVKNSRFRRIYISDDLERLHSEYVWELCDADAHRAVDLENWWVFVNLRRGEWLAPLRPETVYDLVDGLKRRLGKAVPSAWTPHWWRHTHATALLLSGAHEHVVMRRMGHADVQTTLTLYGWVTEEAELKTLANWKSFTTNWRGLGGSSA
ncbi:site-specific integrase [Streptomyces sp. NBC_01221]|uniref:tyrosine-type recombinase/integrase n=1 Tax=Streptomyces sp. NBC_01221 TaxID=2903782 RepID=UPI002252D149|nr:tyrosine-type recombinase/integrase [Streptomyces sp. NBC_01221]MCX4791829.1 site-specific integrase [Streptomyces sp. NBC_01221]